MSLSKFNENVNNHQSLPDKPTLTSQELKALWDKAVVDIKNYINQSLTEEIDSKINEFQTEINSNTSSINNMLNSVYPVGSIYMSVNNTNPSTIFGGTWVAWGSGKVPVGVNTSETEFNTVEKTGGEKTHELTTNEMPEHSHSYVGSGHRHDISGHTHSFTGYTDNAGNSGSIWNIAAQSNSSGVDASGIAQKSSTSGTVGYATASKNGSENYTDMININTNHSHRYEGTTDSGNLYKTDIGYESGTIMATGGGQAHNNLQPYITCYMWKRTA